MAKLKLRSEEAMETIASVAEENTIVEPIVPIIKKQEDKISVDAGMFKNLVNCLVMGKTSHITGQAAIRRIGEMMGCKSHQECIDNWKKLKSA